MYSDDKLNETVVIESSTSTYFMSAIRNAVRISKAAHPIVKKVLFRRDHVEVEVSEFETEQSLYKKFIKAQKERVCNLAINNNEF